MELNRRTKLSSTDQIKQHTDQQINADQKTAAKQLKSVSLPISKEAKKSRLNTNNDARGKRNQAITSGTHITIADEKASTTPGGTIGSAFDSIVEIASVDDSEASDQIDDVLNHWSDTLKGPLNGAFAIQRLVGMLGTLQNGYLKIKGDEKLKALYQQSMKEMTTGDFIKSNKEMCKELLAVNGFNEPNEVKFLLQKFLSDETDEHMMEVLAFHQQLHEAQTNFKKPSDIQKELEQIMGGKFVNRLNKEELNMLDNHEIFNIRKWVESDLLKDHKDKLGNEAKLKKYQDQKIKNHHQFLLLKLNNLLTDSQTNDKSESLPLDETIFETVNNLKLYDEIDQLKNTAQGKQILVYFEQNTVDFNKLLNKENDSVLFDFIGEKYPNLNDQQINDLVININELKKTVLKNELIKKLKELNISTNLDLIADLLINNKSFEDTLNKGFEEAKKMHPQSSVYASLDSKFFKLIIEYKKQVTGDDYREKMIKRMKVNNTQLAHDMKIKVSKAVSEGIKVVSAASKQVAEHRVKQFDANDHAQKILDFALPLGELGIEAGLPVIGTAIATTGSVAEAYVGNSRVFTAETKLITLERELIDLQKKERDLLNKGDQSQTLGDVRANIKQCKIDIASWSNKKIKAQDIRAKGTLNVASGTLALAGLAFPVFLFGAAATKLMATQTGAIYKQMVHNITDYAHSELGQEMTVDALNFKMTSEDDIHIQGEKIRSELQTVYEQLFKPFSHINFLNTLDKKYSLTEKELKQLITAKNLDDILDQGKYKDLDKDIKKNIKDYIKEFKLKDSFKKNVKDELEQAILIEFGRAKTQGVHESSKHRIKQLIFKKTMLLRRLSPNTVRNQQELNDIFMNARVLVNIFKNLNQLRDYNRAPDELTKAFYALETTNDEVASSLDPDHANRWEKEHLFEDLKAEFEKLKVHYPADNPQAFIDDLENIDTMKRLIKDMASYVEAKTLLNYFEVEFDETNSVFKINDKEFEPSKILQFLKPRIELINHLKRTNPEFEILRNNIFQFSIQFGDNEISQSQFFPSEFNFKQGTQDSRLLTVTKIIQEMTKNQAPTSRTEFDLPVPDVPPEKKLMSSSLKSLSELSGEEKMNSYSGLNLEKLSNILGMNPSDHSDGDQIGEFANNLMKMLGIQPSNLSIEEQSLSQISELATKQIEKIQLLIKNKTIDRLHDYSDHMINNFDISSKEFSDMAIPNLSFDEFNRISVGQLIKFLNSSEGTPLSENP